MANSKTFGLEVIGRRFNGLLAAFGARAMAAEAAVACGYASAADSTQCPFIIKPSSRQRVVIDAHRSDWL